MLCRAFRNRAFIRLCPCIVAIAGIASHAVALAQQNHGGNSVSGSSSQETPVCRVALPGLDGGSSVPSLRGSVQDVAMRGGEDTGGSIPHLSRSSRADSPSMPAQSATTTARTTGAREGIGGIPVLPPELPKASWGNESNRCSDEVGTTDGAGGIPSALHSTATTLCSHGEASPFSCHASDGVSGVPCKSGSGLATATSVAGDRGSSNSSYRKSLGASTQGGRCSSVAFTACQAARATFPSAVDPGGGSSIPAVVAERGLQALRSSGTHQSGNAWQASGGGEGIGGIPLAPSAVEVIDLSGRPLVGVRLLVSDEFGHVIAVGQTNIAGQFVVTLPSRGVFRLHVFGAELIEFSMISGACLLVAVAG
jgi:hypothetical protein